MKKILILVVLALASGCVVAQVTPFERSGKKATATYDEVIEYYQALDKKYEELQVLTCGPTDIGKPLHLVVLSKNKVFSPSEIKKQNKRVLLINNGIHPGEPEGIDASMMLVRDLLASKKLPDDVVICLIPVYNIDGCLNRGVSRVSQNGPEAYGFRGNYQNLDLNRDFIKSDSENSKSFQKIFNEWRPDIFVDTHTSNGSDYQYTMTLIPTQKDKLNPVLSGYLCNTMVPFLYERMKKEGFELTPYVNSIGETPDEGITGFLETPRYSTGYAALHNVIGFMPETHMLKSYDKRVASTYSLLKAFVEVVQRDAKVIGENKRKADDMVMKGQDEFALDWKLDRSVFDTIKFKGYEAKHKTSEVSGLPRLYYDRNAPFEKEIKVWNKFDAALSVKKPVAYIIPRAWAKVIALLKLNGVKTTKLQKDMLIDVEAYYIVDYKSPGKPFEGHYLHSGVKLRTEKQQILYRAGDEVVYVDQPANRYIVEMLEPQGVDSFFTWNFFDSVMGQKEHFSDYVFEDTAADLLKRNPELREKLEQEKLKNATLAKSADAQLDFVYKNSPYHEPTYMRYPVTRVMSSITLK